MKVSISELLKVNNASMDVGFDGDLGEFASTGGDFMVDRPVRFRGKLTNNNGILKLDGQLTVEYTARCYRCLKELPGRMDIEINEDFMASSVKTDEDDEAYAYEGNILAFDKALKDNIILHTPMKMVCREECRGLCASCGTDLNEKDCGCRKVDIHPQMEKLKDFFKN